MRQLDGHVLGRAAQVLVGDVTARVEVLSDYGQGPLDKIHSVKHDVFGQRAEPILIDKDVPECVLGGF